MNNKKATALALAVTMVLTGGTVLTGCSENTKKQTNQEDKDNYTHHSSPFIYYNSSVNTDLLSGSTGGNIKSSSSTSSGWQSWSSPKSSGGYSGVHAGSVAG